MSIDTRPTTPRADAVDRDRRAVRRDARIAVGVAAGDDADAHVALGRDSDGRSRPTSPAVNDWTAISAALRASSPALQPELGGRALRERRRAVQHDAGANPVAMRLGMRQDRRRIGERARPVEAVGAALERARAARRRRPAGRRSRNASSSVIVTDPAGTHAAARAPRGRSPARSRGGSCRCSSSGRPAAARRCAPPRASRSARRVHGRPSRRGARRASRSASSKQPSSSSIGFAQPKPRSVRRGLGLEDRDAVGPRERRAVVAERRARARGRRRRPSARPRRATRARRAGRRRRWRRWRGARTAPGWVGTRRGAARTIVRCDGRRTDGDRRASGRRDQLVRNA